MGPGELRGWRAYYADGSTVSSAEAAPRELADGVAGIVEFRRPPYRRIVDGGDHLWWDGAQWQATDTVWDGWVPPPDGVDPELVVRGAGMEDEAWEQLRCRMLADREWPEMGEAA